MTTLILTLVVMLLVVVGMAIGVIVANKPIKGSCGGMTALGIDTECDICGGDVKKCEKTQESATDNSTADAATAQAYDASKPQN